MGCLCVQWIPVVTMLITNIAMGLTNVLVKKTLDGGINHMIFATYRLAISAVFLIPVAYLWERKTRPKITFTILCQHFFSGLLGASLTQFFFLLGLEYTSPTLACAFLSMQPAITFAMALIVRQEKLNIRRKTGMAKILGTLLCVGGALFLTFYKGLPITNPQTQAEALNGSTNHAKKTQNWVLGCLFLLIGNSFLCSWMLLQAKINVKFPCQYSSTVLMSIFATFQCALLSLIISRDASAWLLTNKIDLLTVIYAGVVGQALATVAASWCIRKTGPVFTCTFSPVILIAATVFDILLLHAKLYLGSIIGSIVIVMGLYVFLWGKTKDVDKTESSTKEPSLVELPEDHDEESKNDCTKLPI